MFDMIIEIVKWWLLINVGFVALALCINKPDDDLADEIDQSYQPIRKRYQ